MTFVSIVCAGGLVFKYVRIQMGEMIFSIILGTSLGRLDLVYVTIQKAIHFGLNHFYLWAESCDICAGCYLHLAMEDATPLLVSQSNWLTGAWVKGDERCGIIHIRCILIFIYPFYSCIYLCRGPPHGIIPPLTKVMRRFDSWVDICALHWSWIALKSSTRCQKLTALAT